MHHKIEERGKKMLNRRSYAENVKNANWELSKIVVAPSMAFQSEVENK